MYASCTSSGKLERSTGILSGSGSSPNWSQTARYLSKSIPVSL